jgi:hypothetical protein
MTTPPAGAHRAQGHPAARGGGRRKLVVFADLATRRTLRDKLQRIEGVHIGEDALSKRPPIRLHTLARDDAIERFLEAFDWALQQLHSAV